MDGPEMCSLSLSILVRALDRIQIDVGVGMSPEHENVGSCGCNLCGLLSMQNLLAGSGLRL